MILRWLTLLAPVWGLVSPADTNVPLVCEDLETDSIAKCSVREGKYISFSGQVGTVVLVDIINDHKTATVYGNCPFDGTRFILQACKIPTSQNPVTVFFKTNKVVSEAEILSEEIGASSLAAAGFGPIVFHVLTENQKPYHLHSKGFFLENIVGWDLATLIKEPTNYSVTLWASAARKALEKFEGLFGRPLGIQSFVTKTNLALALNEFPETYIGMHGYRLVHIRSAWIWAYNFWSAGFSHCDLHSANLRVHGETLTPQNYNSVTALRDLGLLHNVTNSEMLAYINPSMYKAIDSSFVVSFQNVKSPKDHQFVNPCLTGGKSNRPEDVSRMISNTHSSLAAHVNMNSFHGLRPSFSAKTFAFVQFSRVQQEIDFIMSIASVDSFSRILGLLPHARRCSLLYSYYLNHMMEVPFKNVAMKNRYRKLRFQAGSTPRCTLDDYRVIAKLCIEFLNREIDRLMASPVYKRAYTKNQLRLPNRIDFTGKGKWRPIDPKDKNAVNQALAEFYGKLGGGQ